MTRTLYSFLALFLITVLAHCQLAAQQPSGATIPHSDVSGQQGFSLGSAGFVENRGQIVDDNGEQRPDILYSIPTRTTAVYFSRNRVSYVFAKMEAVQEKGHNGEEEDHIHEAGYRVSGLYRMDVELIGSNPQPIVEPGKPLEGYSSYYLPHCPNGITGVRSYGELTYRDIYPNIDMVLRATDGGTKCDFVVHPGGRVDDIQLRYVAADRITSGASGTIMAANPLGHIEENAPYTYQGSGETRKTITSRFRIDGDVVRFNIGQYDQNRTLVIDPDLKWATYFGGSNSEAINGGDPSEVDRTGNVIVAGYVNGFAFPSSTGAFQTTYAGGSFDAFIVKFSSRGTRLWATYYGGSEYDQAHGIVSDRSRNIFVAGHTESADFPVNSGVFQSKFGGDRDAFVAKFDSNGRRQWCTFYGGSNWDDGYGFAADSAGNVAVFITTASDGLGTPGTFQPTKPSPANNQSLYYDVLIAKLTGAGAGVWATYFGGDKQEFGYAGGSDNHQNIILTGWTYSSNFPVSAGAQQSTLGGRADAFVVKLTPDGNRQWSTYYGGFGAENDGGSTTGFCGLATDGDDNIFIAGLTTGNFPVTPGAMQTAFGGGEYDGFAVKFDSNGVRQWATYVGGRGNDIAAGIASNAVGGVLVAGRTSSTSGFPVTGDAYQSRNAGGYDAFIVKLNRAGENVWSTYYGGTGNDYGEGISFDPFGSVIIIGSTESNDFPVADAYQSKSGGKSDAFVVLFCDIDPGVIDTSGATTFCQGDSVVLSVQRGYSTVLWSNGSTDDSIVVRDSGEFWVRLTNGAGCEATTDIIRVRVNPNPKPVITGQTMICPGDSTVLDAGPGFATYHWSSGDTTQKIVVRTPGIYSVDVANATGCGGASQIVEVSYFPSSSQPVITGVNNTLTSTPALTYQWSYNGQPIAGATSQQYVASEPGTYTVEITDGNSCYAISDPYDLADGEAWIELAELSAVPGEQIRIPIRITRGSYLDNFGLDAYTMTIRFNKSILYPLNDTSRGVLDGHYRVMTVTGHRNGVTDGEIGQLEFTAALGDSVATVVHIDSFRWDVGKGRVHTADGLVRINPQGGWKLFLPDNRIGLLPPYPNPVMGPTEIGYQIIEPGRTRIYLIDILGQRLPYLLDEEVQPGSYQLAFDPSGIPSGVYFLTLETPTNRLVQPMQIRH